MQGLLIKKIAPDYPPLALQARIEGEIILNVEISNAQSREMWSTPVFSAGIRSWRMQP
jgi:hypothetical protein